MEEFLLHPLTAVIVGILVGRMVPDRLWPKWEKRVPSKGASWVRDLGYYQNEDNQWIHKTLPDWRNVVQTEEKDLPARIGDGMKFVRSKFLRKRIYYWTPQPSRKVFFLFPASK